MKKRMFGWNNAILALLGVPLMLVSISTILYRDLLFRDYESFDLVDSDNSVSILFVGNSHIFWGKVPKQLHIISKEYGIKIAYKDISRNGAHLSRTKDEAIIELQSGKYDYVVFQENTRLLPDNIEDFLAIIRLLCDEARGNGTIPVLFNPAVADNSSQKVYSEAYLTASDENDAILVNAGDAWIYAYQMIPGISLYAWDGMHANNAGAFYTACLFAAVLFELHIVEIPNNNLYKGNDALSLAQAAREFARS